MNILLPVLGQNDSKQSTVVISGAKWREVEVKGWSHEPSQKKSGVLLLSPTTGSPSSPIPGITKSGMRIENPIADGGGIDLEIQLDESVFVFGNDDLLIIASQEVGNNRSIAIKSIDGPHPTLTKSFRFISVTNSDQAVRRDSGKKSLQTTGGSRVVSLGEQDGPEFPAIPTVEKGHGPMMITKSESSERVKTKLVVLELSNSDFSKQNSLQFKIQEAYVVLKDGRKYYALGTLFSMGVKGEDGTTKPHALLLHKNYSIQVDGEKCSIHDAEGMALLSINPYDGPFCKNQQDSCQFVIAFSDDVPFDQVKLFVFHGTTFE